MKRILVVVPNEKDSGTGGQKYNKYLIKFLERIGGNVSFLTDEMLLFKTRLSPIYNILYFLKLNTLSKADVIITNSRLYPRLFLVMNMIKLLNKKNKTICIHHHYNFLAQTGFKKKLNRYLELNFLRKFDTLIVPSPYVKEITGNLLPKKRIFFIEIGFVKEHSAPKEELNDDHLLYVGSIEKRKGLDLLIKSLQEVSEHYTLDIIGNYNEDDNYFKMLIAKVSENNMEDRVFFRGRVSKRELSEYFSNASIFVFPSLHEGYGMVIKEAMLYGIPVIAFNNSAIPYLVQDGVNGILVENCNIAEFSKKLTHLLKNKELRQKLRQNNINLAKEIRSMEDVDNDIRKFYYGEILKNDVI
ncbi:glycosyltransferase family 4 protein [Aggregatimonas sangjinii]|uniref:Glycosyltransferase family 4 protein n=1 Tax=Aggregatimonas sangjinii TaxID=2583587 RepID=A0A5B7SXQ1_9FLAO|nr:glycosyltransferase family 4 protein [Aggregatimonas sangjinii]QCX01858.1 glycosyltransferase family 4 protein [Aggregatimonas sangjinii]